MCVYLCIIYTNIYIIYIYIYIYIYILKRDREEYITQENDGKEICKSKALTLAF